MVRVVQLRFQAGAQMFDRKGPVTVMEGLEAMPMGIMLEVTAQRHRRSGADIHRAQYCQHGKLGPYKLHALGGVDAPW